MNEKIEHVDGEFLSIDCITAELTMQHFSHFLSQKHFSCFFSIIRAEFNIFGTQCRCQVTVILSSASILEEVANLLCAQINSASYPQRDGI